MDRRVAAFDWASTPLGPRGEWPRSLGAIVDLVLAHPIPSVVLWGPDLVQVYNDAYARMTDAEPAASLGKPAREAWEGGWEVDASIFERVFRRGESVLLEDHPFPIDRHGRREKGYFTVSYSPVRGDGVRVAGIFLTVIETTAKIRTGAALRASEARTLAAFEALPSGVCVHDSDGRILLANRIMQEYLPSGVIPSRDEPHRGRWRAWWPDGRSVEPDDFPGARALRGETVVPGLEMLHRRDDGTEVWTQVSTAPVRDPEGRIVGAASVVSDVNELKRAGAAIRATEQRLRAVAANLPNAAVFVVDSALRYSLAEGQSLRAAGFAPSDLEGKAVAEAMGPELAAEYEPRFRRALAGERLSVEHALHGRHYATHLAPLPGSDGQAVAALAVSYDITDRVRAEEEVRRSNGELEARVAERTAELVEALGSLEGEMARRRELARRLGTAQEDERRRVSRDLHDSVGQLLAALPIVIRAVEGMGDLPAPVAGKLAEAQSLAGAVNREVHTLAVRLRPIALDDLGLEAALDLLVSEWSARVGVRADFQAAGIGRGRLPSEVETTIYRVVQEALTNVAKHARAQRVSIVVNRPDGHVSVVVEDDGVGFNPDAKPPGRLGLLGMSERVELVGGELDVESSSGEGTTVLIRIPLPEAGGT